MTSPEEASLLDAVQSARRAADLASQDYTRTLNALAADFRTTLDRYARSLAAHQTPSLRVAVVQETCTNQPAAPTVASASSKGLFRRRQAARPAQPAATPLTPVGKGWLLRGTGVAIVDTLEHNSGGHSPYTTYVCSPAALVVEDDGSLLTVRSQRTFLNRDTRPSHVVPWTPDVLLVSEYWTAPVVLLRREQVAEYLEAVLSLRRTSAALGGEGAYRWVKPESPAEIEFLRSHATALVADLDERLTAVGASWLA